MFWLAQCYGDIRPCKACNLWQTTRNDIRRLWIPTNEMCSGLKATKSSSKASSRRVVTYLTIIWKLILFSGLTHIYWKGHENVVTLLSTVSSSTGWPWKLTSVEVRKAWWDCKVRVHDKSVIDLTDAPQCQDSCVSAVWYLWNQVRPTTVTARLLILGVMAPDTRSTNSGLPDCSERCTKSLLCDFSSVIKTLQKQGPRWA